MNMRLTPFAVCLLGLLTAPWGAPAFCQAQKPQLVVQTGHTGMVTSVAFSPNGRTFASGSYDQILKLWDTATGQLLRTMTGKTGVILSVAFSPDGKTVASGSDTIKFWDVATGQLKQTLIDTRHPGGIGSLAFSPDGKTLASGSSGGTILWNAVTGQELRTLTRATNEVWAVTFSPDGKFLASGGNDHTITLWDAETGQLRQTLIGHTGDITSVALSPDGRTIASSNDLGTIQLWDAKTGKLCGTLTRHTGVVTSVAFSPDGKTLASGSEDETINFWDAATGKLRQTLVGHAGVVTSVAFSPDGKTLVSGSNDGTILWDAVTGQESHTFTRSTRSVDLVAFSSDGKSLASGSMDGTMLWDTVTGYLRYTLAKDSDGSSLVAFSPDGRTLVSNSTNYTLNICDLTTSQFLHTLTGHTGVIFTIAFSPDGKTLAGGSGDSTVKLWDAATGKLQRTLTGHTGVVTSVAFSPDGKTLASGSEDDTINFWDAATGKLRGTLVGHTGPVHSVTFSPDGKTLASSGNNGTVLWDAITGQELHTFISTFCLVAFSPDGSLLTGTNGETIKFWNAATGQEMHTLTEHSSGFSSVSFSPDGKTLACAIRETINLRDTATGQELCSLYALGENAWAVVTPDGRFDTGNLDNIQSIHWVLPDQPFTPVPVEAFFAQYYTPGLLAHLLNRDPLPALPDIATINHVQPRVAIETIVPHPGDAPGLVDVTVSYSGQRADAVQPDGTKKAETSGAYDLRLFRNGQLVAALPEDAAPGAAPTDLASGTVGKTLTHTFTVRLARDGAASVPFTAYAFNSDKVKSQTASLTYTPKTPLPVVKGRAWVLAFGVNAYSDPHWDLHYAAADAQVFGSQLVPRLQKTGRYSQVTFVPLVSDTGGPAPDTLPATKMALRAVLMALAGKAPDAQSAPFTSALKTLGVSKAAPEDMVLLAFSCHGDTDAKTGEYYLFPADIGPDQSHGLTPDLEAHSLSSAELTQWMQGVDAGEMAMVIDSCHSAAAAGQAFKPGPMDSPGLGQLAYYKRMRILSASAADAVAKEYPDLGHGLLTAALVSDGLVSGGAKPAAGQSALTVGPWLTFAEGDVPKLDARENGAKGPQAKHGLPGHKATALVNEMAETPDTGLQKPSLFDFHRAGTPDAAVSVGGGKAP